jgi:retron-type reverse transcriptase
LQSDRLAAGCSTSDRYRGEPVRQVPIPKAGKPGEWRTLGVPTIFDRVCQQALLNRLEPIFKAEFDDASFGYRRGRSPHGALRKVWKEVETYCVSLIKFKALAAK